ncbi:techylectin-5A-like [Homarus americanus]|uniref:Techylectin-5A-like 2 n=1 Tax=Homarus americanus TaxID=6706 RepID=A0A8J5K405_HOMAM|nr:techylectin-5A-like [Homarus americanus]KAG7167133.1 techylectin-5A-like 2 [Homarus americanus]
MGGSVMMKAAVLVMQVVAAVSQASQPEGCPVVPSLLQAAGYSPYCVASALASCAHQGDGKPFLEEMRETLAEVRQALTEAEERRKRPRHCRDLLDSGDTGTGIRQVYPFLQHPDAPVTVYCDHIVDGGGWTVFQRRRNLTEREDFYRTWVEYQLGFGHFQGEFWLGLDLLHHLTSTTLQELRIDLKAYENQHRWAKYGQFYIGSPDTYYRIKIGRYKGDAGDGLGSESARHNGYSFSTHDADHDGDGTNCAQVYRGAWWYDKCHISNLNGYQYVGKHDSYADGINWQPWKGYHYSLMETTMMIRPAF